MTGKIKIGIIGCGHLGKFHIKNLVDLSKEREDIEIKGVYDINPEKMEYVKDNFHLNTYKSKDELYNDINTIIIVTPTVTHYELAKSAIEKNINCFIEKPVTSKVTEAYDLLEYAKNKNIKIQVGHIERFNPALLALDKYDINPLFIESHRLSEFNPRGTDVSVIQDLMIHDIDIILSLVNSEIESIEANGVAVITNKIDIANSRIKFKNGCVANLTASRISQKKMRKMRIFQKDMYISVDFSKNSSEIFNLLRDEDKSKSTGVVIGPFEYEKNKILISYENKTVTDINPMKYELNKFFDSIVKDLIPEIDIKSAVEAVEVAQIISDKIQESLLKMNK
jgi:predicted dehydrogenase